MFHGLDRPYYYVVIYIVIFFKFITYVTATIQTNYNLKSTFVKIMYPTFNISIAIY